MYVIVMKFTNKVAIITGTSKERNYVTAAIRTARDLDAGEEDWLEFINNFLLVFMQ